MAFVLMLLPMGTQAQSVPLDPVTLNMMMGQLGLGQGLPSAGAPVLQGATAPLPPTQPETDNNKAANQQAAAMAEASTNNKNWLLDRWCRAGAPDRPDETLLSLSSSDFGILLKAVASLSPIERDHCKRAAAWLPQFGYDQITARAGLDRAASASLAGAGDNYVLGIGDTLSVTLLGNVSQALNVSIDREGRLVLPGLAPISAAGRPLGDVRAEIKARVKRELVGTDIYLSLVALRQITVVVLGEVQQPGPVQLSSFASVIDALAAVGGASKTGSLRRIEIRRPGARGRTTYFDLYDLITGQTGQANAGRLRDGDQIIVPPLGPTVAIGGKVNRGGIFELGPREGEIAVSALLDFAAGATRPQGNELSLLRVTADGRQEIRRVGAGGFAQAGDLLLVNWSDNAQRGFVSLSGHVLASGRRAWMPGMTVASMIRDLDALGPNVYTPFMALIRGDAATGRRQYYPLSLAAVLTRQADYSVAVGDEVLILAQSDIAYLTHPQVRAVAMHGSAALPEAGACAALVDLGRLRDRAGAPRFDIFKARASELTALDALGGLMDSKDPAAPCPAIFQRHPRLLPLLVEHSVAVVGEASNPGIYPIAKDTSLGLVIDSAGGATPIADPNRVVLERFQAGATGDAQLSSQVLTLGDLGKSPTALQPGDVVTLWADESRKALGVVQLAGEVRQPGAYRLRRGESLSSLIARAGGLNGTAYPLGAIFTRLSVAETERRGLEKAREQMGQAALAAAASGAPAQLVTALSALSRSSDDKIVVGRMVVEADPDILAIRPELDVALEDGDRIVIPKRPSTVYVLGAVLNAGALQYVPGARVEDYLKRTGGLQKSADRGRSFVIYPNGEAAPSGSGWFSSSSPPVPPGSTIVVPQDPTPFNLWTFSQNSSQLISSLALTAAAIANLAD